MVVFRPRRGNLWWCWRMRVVRGKDRSGRRIPRRSGVRGRCWWREMR